MKYLFTCKKLVRNFIPHIMTTQGCIVDAITLEHSAHVDALKQKLQEEALEVASAQNIDEIIEEIADVQEIIDTLISKLGIDRQLLKNVKDHKASTKGSFSDGCYLKSVVIADTLPLVQKFLENPAKYPAVSME